MNKSRIILLTGGAGFIGSNLVEFFLELGDNVICLDDFSTGKRENIEPFLVNPNFRLIEGDIRDFEVCEEACKNVDYVFHQAALGSVPRSIDNPIRTNSVNINGFLNMLVASKDARVKRFIYAASSSTYGDSLELPKVEDRIGKPLSPYAITKYVNELYAENFSKLYGLKTIGLRYFNVFGKRQDPNGAYAAVIPLFIKQFLSYENPMINGDGSYSRDFTYVKNVVLANKLAIDFETKDSLSEVINVACGGRISLIEMADIIKTELLQLDPEIGSVQIQFGPSRKGDVAHSQASIEKAERVLGYRAEYDFKQGINDCVEWYFKTLKSL